MLFRRRRRQKWKMFLHTDQMLLDRDSTETGLGRVSAESSLCRILRLAGPTNSGPFLPDFLALHLFIFLIVDTLYQIGDALLRPEPP